MPDQFEKLIDKLLSLERPDEASFSNKREWSTVSKALARSRKTAPVTKPLSMLTIVTKPMSMLTMVTFRDLTWWQPLAIYWLKVNLL